MVQDSFVKRVDLKDTKTPPVAEPRIGAAREEFVVPDSFFEPLPDEILKAFGCQE
jgi:hypothetical protein